MKNNMKTTDDQSELFIVVDKYDNVLGYRTRYECHHDKRLTHRSICIVLRNTHGDILLQKRSMSKDTWAGFYTVAASGHVTKGDSVEEAAERELFEEIGVRTPLTFQTKFYIETDEESEIVAVFTGNHDGPFTTHPEEVESVVFFRPDEIRHMQDKLTSTAVTCLHHLHIL